MDSEHVRERSVRTFIEGFKYREVYVDGTSSSKCCFRSCDRNIVSVQLRLPRPIPSKEARNPSELAEVLDGGAKSTAMVWG